MLIIRHKRAVTIETNPSQNRHTELSRDMIYSQSRAKSAHYTNMNLLRSCNTRHTHLTPVEYLQLADAGDEQLPSRLAVLLQVHQGVLLTGQLH